MQVSILFCLVAVMAIETSGAQAVPPVLLDEAVYEIMNKFDGGALTVDERSMDSVQVFLREYNSTAGQKWRLKSSIGESFYLRPTSNERAVLDLDQNTLGIWGRMFSFGSQKRWNLNWMGEGFLQIQNRHTPEWCLTTRGLDKLVGVADCENSPSQQWIFTQL